MAEELRPGAESGQSQHSTIIPQGTKSYAELARRFHALFLGCERAHGSYTNINWDQARSDGKYKGDAVTKREPITDALWLQHLNGTYGIGVIPIRDDSTCLFGAIDIDVYADLDIGRVAATLAKMALPLVACRSKSGGVHLYLFCAQPVSAADMQKRLREIAATLGYGTAEIFPKQTKMCGDRDLGSWINACYQNAAETNRYAVMPNGDAMTADEFLDRAEASKQPAEWFVQPLAQNADADALLPGGPPCLQRLMELGFPPGTWNTGTFNLGVYCRKAHPDDWEQHLARLNAKNFPPDRWPMSDLNDIKKSLKKKDYHFQCNDSLLVRYCDRNTCQGREYGIRGENSLPVLTSLSKLCTDPPTWYLDLEGHRLELSTEELLNPLAFQVKCCNHSIVVPVVGRGKWTEHIKPYVVKANEIPVADDGLSSDDGSAKGQFLELFERFCVGRTQGHQMEEVLGGKPFTHAGRTYFRFFALLSHLNRMGFKDFKRPDVVAALKALGATNSQERVGGKVTRVWTVPAFTRDETSWDVVPMAGPDGF